MYETPQYLTPGGFRRLPKNPFKKKLEDIKESTGRNSDQLRKNVLLPARPAALRKRSKPLELSDKAAALIAQALKGMLKS
jgi:hypothetical protein